jgi:tetratricopeptide (TPR) repeat protein
VLTKSICYLLALGGFYVLSAADEQQLALASRAHSDFDRVQQAAGPELPDATRCEQSQAAWLPVAPPTDRAQAHFQKGYCTLAEAMITRSPAEFLSAAAAFDNARKAWPERAFRAGRNHTPEPVPAGLVLLAPIARLQAAVIAAGSESPHVDNADLERAKSEIAPALDHPVCENSLMPAATCRTLLESGQLWLGWIKLQQDELFQAAEVLAHLPDSGWAHYASGKKAFGERHYTEAATQFGQAMDTWTREQHDTSASLATRLAPQPDRAQALEDWGGAQLLSGDLPAAIATLDTAVKAAPNPARALFLRARAEELAGRMDAAMADYSMASRTALAHTQNLASGEAHLYRGILLYRRKDFEHAENEFASALNFDIPKELKGDAIAWRHMAAVAAGACTASRATLEESLGAVSPYFPKDEARSLAGSCPLTSSNVSNSAI